MGLAHFEDRLHVRFFDHALHEGGGGRRCLRLLASRGIKAQAFLRKPLRVGELHESDFSAVGDLVAVQRRNRAVARDHDVGIVLVELDRTLSAANAIAFARHEFAGGAAREGAVPRVAFARRRIDDEETLAADRNVKRVAGLRQRSLREIGNRCAVLHEGHTAVGERKTIRACRRGKIFLELNALALEPVGVDVGEIVGDDVELALKRDLPRQSD